jgi:hypothetical protein
MAILEPVYSFAHSRRMRHIAQKKGARTKPGAFLKPAVAGETLSHKLPEKKVQAAGK